MNEREQRIREHAYMIWEREGHPGGREREHWLQAEQEVGDESGWEEGGLEEGGLEGDPHLGGPSFRPVDAAEAPPVQASVPLPPGAVDYPVEPDRAVPPRPNPADAEPNVGITGGEVEPVSEIASIRRTLEVPPERRAAGSPAGDPEGALSRPAGPSGRPRRG